MTATYPGRDKHYTHTQGSPSTEWTIDHNLNKHPSITVVDSAGTVVWCAASYPSLNRVVLSFSAAFSGRAYMN